MNDTPQHPPARSDETARVMLQTRLPAALRVYLKRYAKHHSLKLEGMLTEVLTHFVSLRPDLRGLRWRTPQSTRNDQAQSVGWAQINLYVPAELAGQVAGLSLETEQSKATILYTSFIWFAQYLRPPMGPQGESLEASFAAHPDQEDTHE